MSGALRIFKTKLGDNVLKVKVSLVDVVNSFYSYLCQFLIRPVWRKISICKINLNLIIQKAKLKRNRQDEIHSSRLPSAQLIVQCQI